MYFTKLVSFVITLSAATAMAPRVSAQATQAQTQSSGSERSALASELGVFIYPQNKQDKAQQVKGGAVKGAAKGAAGGAAIGGIAGDAGTGAAVGATAGAVRGRRQQKKANKEAEQQAQQNAQARQQQTLDTFKKAFSTCMDAREYSVK